MKDEMKSFDILKTDGSRVSCVREMPDPLKGIVIAIHGFTSSKESSTYRQLLKRLPAAGFGVICIDLPGHGTGESSKEILSIHGALDSIGAAEQEALREHPGCRIYYFSLTLFSLYRKSLKSESTKTRAVIASTTGTMRGQRHTSWRPFI